MLLLLFLYFSVCVCFFLWVFKLFIEPRPQPFYTDTIERRPLLHTGDISPSSHRFSFNKRLKLHQRKNQNKIRRKKQKKSKKRTKIPQTSFNVSLKWMATCSCWSPRVREYGKWQFEQNQFPFSAFIFGCTVFCWFLPFVHLKCFAIYTLQMYRPS